MADQLSGERSESSGSERSKHGSTPVREPLTDQQRDHSARARLRAGEQRDAIADARDVAALARDQAAAARDLAMQQTGMADARDDAPRPLSGAQIIVRAGDQPGGRQIECRMHGVTDAHVKRTGFAGYDDRVVPDITPRL